MKSLILILSLAILVTGCTTTLAKMPTSDNLKQATFAGGCFWCMEPSFEALEGVYNVTSGYTGGHVSNPTYEQVTSGTTGHYEAITLLYDPSIITYEELLQTYWQQINPTDSQGQFADKGSQYLTVIFYHDEEQKLQATQSKSALEMSKKFDQPIATAILPAQEFWIAEDYHQDYYLKSKVSYEAYKKGSGRAAFIEETWKEVPPSLEETLTPLQYEVTQQCSTEPPFKNEYWDNHEPGIYVDIVSGQPLFSSLDKFDSGTGWPSFTQPLANEAIIEDEDTTLGMTRTEIKSSEAGSHLGHIFDDGPVDKGGLRYCINSASLRFIHKDNLTKEGYEAYAYLFN